MTERRRQEPAPGVRMSTVCGQPLKIARRAAAVPPFIVMEVLKAANERAAAARTSFHLEVGEPGSGPPAGAGRRAPGAPPDPARLYRGPGPAGPAAPHRRALWRVYGQEVDPAADRRHGRRVGRLHAGLPRRLRCRRPGCRARAGLSGLPQHPAGPRRRGGTSCRSAPRPVPAHARRSRPSTGRCTASCSRAPPTRPAPCSASTILRPWPPSAATAVHPPRHRRDLPRHHLRGPGRDRARHGTGRDRDQQLLQVLLHDRLAARLAGRAAGAGPAGRAPGPEPLHLAPGARAARGSRRPSPTEPSSTRRIATYRRNRDLLVAPPGRPASMAPPVRRLLPLCRCRAI